MIPVILTGCEKAADLRDDVISRFASEKEHDSAVEIVEVFFNHVIKKEFEKAFDYVYIANGSNRTIDDFIAEFSNTTQIISFEINWVEVKNNIAIAGVDLIDSYDNEEKIYKDLQVSLIKDDKEEWKINFWN